jgi:hypothetical protein
MASLKGVREDLQTPGQNFSEQFVMFLWDTLVSETMKKQHHAHPPFPKGGRGDSERRGQIFRNSITMIDWQKTGFARLTPPQ